ncbi:MAG: hypothetical protein ACREX3_00660 [Gammaproteobacteria bacterium]
MDATEAHQLLNGGPTVDGTRNGRATPLPAFGGTSRSCAGADYRDASEPLLVVQLGPLGNRSRVQGHDRYSLRKDARCFWREGLAVVASGVRRSREQPRPAPPSPASKAGRQPSDQVGSPAPRLLALYAGDARDVHCRAGLRADGGQVDAVLVEFDEGLATRAAGAAHSAGLARVIVRQRDAGDPALLSRRRTGACPDASATYITPPWATSHGGFRRRSSPLASSSGRAVAAHPLIRRSEVRLWFIEAGMPDRFHGASEMSGA